MSRSRKPPPRDRAARRSPPPPRPDARPKGGQDPRIAEARTRVVMARRVFGVVAVMGFGAAIALARTTYAGHQKQSVQPLSAPAKFVQVVKRSFLQAGIVAPAQAPPGAATAAS